MDRGSKGAKYWLRVFNDLKARGVEEILIAAIGGLKGIPEALAAVFSATTLQTCIVHLIRNSLDYASWKDRKLPAAIRPIYTAASGEAGQAELDALERSPWGKKFPNDAAASKLIWLALRNITADWGRAAKDWKEAMNQFAILHEDRTELE